MAKRSKSARASTPSPSNLGHVLLFDGMAFYFVPADRISPPIYLSDDDKKMVLGKIDELEKNKSTDVLRAVRIGEEEIPTKLMGHN